MEETDWLCNAELADLALPNEGVLVLGIRRKNGAYIGVPHGRTTIRSGDLLTCYGREKVLRMLASRKAGAEGNSEHLAASEELAKIREEENKESEI